jgi:capsular exopolysaccharide synthesis family protein
LILEQSTPGNISVLNAAAPEYIPSGPNRNLIPILGLLIGLGLSLGFVYARNYFDVSVKSPDDILRKDFNLIGWVPQIRTKGKNAFVHIETIAAHSPESIPSESFRTLRTRIHFSKVVKDAKSILITSAAPSEGKSMVSSNLAISFAYAETRTVLVDCDLRRSNLHNSYNIKKSPGLVDYFLGQAPFESIIRKTEVKNLSIITAGKTSPNPSEIISSPRMQSFLQRLKNEFDLVIIDSPPIMAVTDSEILARLVDMSLLIVYAGKTKQEWTEECVNLLNNGNNSFLGILLNSYNYKEGYHSYHHYYNYNSKDKN